MPNNFPNLTLVLGGANSGKSNIAEKLTRLSGLPKTYVATAQAFDAEMADKIEQHKIQRGTDWHTVEAPLDILGALGSGITLVDCLSMWISNHMLAESQAYLANFAQEVQSHKTPVVCVSNETGMGIVPENAMSREFRTLQGQLNQQVAGVADLVILVVAGIPMVIKGQLPKDLL